MSDFNDYSRFKDEMILRDHLALDRTKLAAERTVIAYIRTFIGSLGAGLGLVKLFEQPFAIVTGYVLTVVSPLFLILGAITYFVERKKLKTLENMPLKTKDGESK